MFARFQGQLQPEALDALREAFGFTDGSLVRQFFTYAAHVLRGDLGLSIAYYPTPVAEVLGTGVGWTVGLAGTAAIISLYGLMVALLMLHAAGLRDRFSRLVVGGVAIYFAAHLFINVSVNVGLLPMTGLTLPLFSTGGSSLLATFLALGLALGLSSHHELQQPLDLAVGSACSRHFYLSRRLRASRVSELEAQRQLPS